jgi:hypothetical protein
MKNAADLSYPIGKFNAPDIITSEMRKDFIKDIERTPGLFRKAVKGLSRKQLDTPYRQGGWTVRQVVHHVPDSHLNAYVRMKLALTEDVPTIKPYDQEKWAELNDTFNTSVSVSLDMLEVLHKRWVNLLKSLSEDDFKRNFKHPEIGIVNIDWAISQYAWHGKHHTAHITSLRKRMGWK